jgi:hypothetical protein
MTHPNEKPRPANDIDAIKRGIAALVATVVVAICEALWRRR